MLFRKLSFPVLAGMAALLVYFASTCGGVTLGNVALAGKLGGWNWQPLANRPFLWLVTLPVRLLPAHAAPLALNLFSAVCAALTIGLLARSVFLLNRFETASRRADRWRVFLPPLLACVLCAFKFSFWGDATSATGEMADILPMALALFFLIKFRAEKNPARLAPAAFFWSLSVVENPLLILTLPLILIFLLVQLKTAILDRALWIRILLFAMVGPALWIFQSLANGILPLTPWGVSKALAMSLRATKGDVAPLYYLFRGQRAVAVGILAFYLLPTLPCVLFKPVKPLRHKSSADFFQHGVSIMAQFLILFGCLWLALEPNVAPQQILQSHTGLSAPLLSFDYLDALGAGFLAGNILNYFGELAGRRGRAGQNDSAGSLASLIATPAMVFLVSLMFLLLTVKNSPAIFDSNRRQLKQLGGLALGSLPTGGGILLSDDSTELAAFDASQTGGQGNSGWLGVDTKLLPGADYREWLERNRPLGWITPETRHELASVEMLGLLDHILRTNRVYYLHPSFGYFFERFYLSPHQAVYELRECATNQTAPPPLAAAQVTENEAFWSRAWRGEIGSMAGSSNRANSRLSKISASFFNRLHVTAPVPYEGSLMAEWYSKALNDWGVSLQRLGNLEEAKLRFEQAHELNTNNQTALFNLESNESLKAGKKMTFAGLGQVGGWFTEDPQRLPRILNRFGPFDHPVFCYLTGSLFAKTGMIRQAAAELERASQLSPDSLVPQYELGLLYTRLRLNDKVLEVVSRVRPILKTMPADTNLDLDLTFLEAAAWMSKSNTAKATGLLQAAMTKYPDSPLVRNRILQAEISLGNLAGADSLVREKLASEPGDIPSLLTLASLSIARGESSNAILILDNILATNNLPAAKMDRAVAYLQMTNTSAAEADYLELEKIGPPSWQVQFGLAQVALQKQDTNTAIKYLEASLTNATRLSPQWMNSRKLLDAMSPKSVSGH